MNKSILQPGGGGSKLSPSVGSNVAQAVYGAGTAYSLTNAAALVDLGTTDPSITLNGSGTYLLLARVRLDYNGATFAAVRNVTVKLRRVNNTAADIANATAGVKTDIVTTVTSSLGDVQIPAVIYQTEKDNDNIQIFAGLDTVPTAGSLDVVEAEIVAIKLS